MRVIATALIVFCASIANAHDGQVMFWMPNAKTCAQILPLEAVQNQYRLTKDDASKLREYGMVLGWLQGYVSATNAHHPKSDGDLAKNLRAADLMNWLFSYCRNDPGADFFTIVNAINNKVLKIAP